MKKFESISLAGKWDCILDPVSVMPYKKVRSGFDTGKTDGTMMLPSNWQIEGLQNYNGTVWFRKSVSLSGKGFDGLILELKGVDYFCDVYANGVLLSQHEGYFQTFYVPIPIALAGTEVEIILKVTSPWEDPETHWPLKKQLIKGIFNHHDCRPGGWDKFHGQDGNTGGVWNDVILHTFSGIYISECLIQPKLYDDYKKCRLLITCSGITALRESIRETIKVTLTTPAGEKIIVKQPVTLHPDALTFSVALDIADPELWWSWDMGTPALYQVSISSNAFRTIHKSFGIREVTLDSNKVFRLNGKRLFLRGTNIIPEQYLSLLTTDRIIHQVNMMKDAGINIVRIHAHVNRSEYYEQCDAAGLMIWQDFPLQWTYDENPAFVSNAVCQIRAMVKQFYNHPSIAFWCCHNEPGPQIETLDPFLYDAVISVDATRIVRLASNYEEHPYDGWYWGKKEHYAARPMGPLVTEFGAQALPEKRSLELFVGRNHVSPPDWEKWKFHNFQYDQTLLIAKVPYGDSSDEFIENSQQYQAELLTTAIRYYRQSRFTPITGIFQFMFIDCWPSITWSVVDYVCKPKKGYYALKENFQPLVVSVNVRQDHYLSGQKLQFDIYIINDLHRSFPEVKVCVRIKDQLLGSIPVPVITEDSLIHFHWEKNSIYLPNLQKGNYFVAVDLVTEEKKQLSSTGFTITIQERLQVTQ